MKYPAYIVLLCLCSIGACKKSSYNKGVLSPASHSTFHSGDSIPLLFSIEGVEKKVGDTLYATIAKVIDNRFDSIIQERKYPVENKTLFTDFLVYHTNGTDTLRITIPVSTLGSQTNSPGSVIYILP